LFLLHEVLLILANRGLPAESSLLVCQATKGIKIEKRIEQKVQA